MDQHLSHRGVGVTSGGRPARFTPNEDLLMRYGIVRYEPAKGREDLDARKAAYDKEHPETEAGE